MKSNIVQIGKYLVGGGHPIRIQSMTNTKTEDIDKTAEQIRELYEAGAEIVRISIYDGKGAKAVPYIKEKLLKKKIFDVALVGDFHFNGHILLKKFPECAKSLDKYRINPGTVDREKGLTNYFSEIVTIAIKYNKPIRIGGNSGSIQKKLLSEFMSKNAQKKIPESSREILKKTLVESVLISASQAESIGLPTDRIILSVKMSDVTDTIDVYQKLHQKCKIIKKMYPLHLGLTEAGGGMKGLISSTAALSVLLKAGIGDTIRISLTPNPRSKRSEEVEACKILLQSLNLRNFSPTIISCPGCGRTENISFQKLHASIEKFIQRNKQEWIKKYPGIENLKIAVMGCIVNGPGESSQADIGISLPGITEKPFGIIYKDGEPLITLKNHDLPTEFKKILEAYIIEKYKTYRQ